MNMISSSLEAFKSNILSRIAGSERENDRVKNQIFS